MSSSDSEDDCYGNLAQKLQKMKNKYIEDNIETLNLLNDSQELDELVKKAKSTTKNAVRTAKRVTRKKKCSSDYEDETTKETKRSTSRKDNSAGTVTPSTPTRGKRGRSSNPPSQIPSTSNVTTTNTSLNTSRRGVSTPRIRNPRKGVSTSRGINTPTRGKRTPRRGSSTSRRGRSTPRRGGRGSRGWPWLQGTSRGQIWRNIIDSEALLSSMPIYSVGNTDEYYDQSDSQVLFSSKPDTNDVIVLDDNDISLDENEELSVKVYWQSSEFFKFTIRRFQKLTQIFDYFAQRENISLSKLLLTYNDKILKPDDTPDSINYSIVKFLEGGTVNESVINLLHSDDEIDTKNRFKLKFQCQNRKKPFELTVGVNDRLSTVMVRCAELLEIPLEKLKFEFDGDCISGKNTARDLELEGGECIDVKIIS